MNANHWKFNAVYAVIYRILGHLWFFRLSHQAKLLEHVWAVQLKRGLHVISIAESVSWVRSSVSLICIPLSIHLSPKIGIYMWEYPHVLPVQPQRLSVRLPAKLETIKTDKGVRTKA
ncbi:hypothetical protein SLEP1_g35872 [Rubroshorea leprosula]|uniref:Uncharacterized protein n=1 Tax=Rubroshorea leprosula TaxID=152421 RepID=A0AAV5KPM2_9ROSI|nr:hypothetical protein SLEP1_g35872 [Rubroshorea leprosula]